LIKPYNSNTSKKNEVRAMFNSIAPKYDLLNHLLSMGIDVIWRKRVIRELKKYKPSIVLDMATGTGDLAIMAAHSGIPQVVGIDLSSEMVAVGNAKILKKELDQKIELKVGDAEKIQQVDNMFDAAMVAFGVRNFEDLEKGLLEMNRVLQPGAPLLVLEFSKARRFPIKQLYAFYSFTFLPFIGKMISKDARAYNYLPESIKAFPSGGDFLSIMKQCNYDDRRQIPLTSGIATIYIGHKR
jgi:demethylmenaquinone methyltransferase/2-methoxy-6-polyprenyl-1,4-benzoquinol methylase